MRRIYMPLLTLLMFVPLAVTRADEDSDLHMVVDKAIEAAGGLEALEKFQKQRGREEGTYYGAGDAMPFTATFAADAPKKFRFDVEGVFTIVLNEDKGWIRANEATMEMNAEQLKAQQEEAFISWVISLVPLGKEKDQFKLSKIDAEEVEGRETIGVQVSSEGHGDVKLFFDKETQDVLKAEYTIKAPEQNFQEVTQELILKNYQKVGDARMATEAVILRDGQKYVEAKMFDMEAVEDFPEDTFAQP